MLWVMELLFWLVGWVIWKLLVKIIIRSWLIMCFFCEFGWKRNWVVVLFFFLSYLVECRVCWVVMFFW